MADIKRLPIADNVEDEAAGWVARHDTGDLDAGAQLEFENWLATSPAHVDAFRQFSHLWSELNDLAFHSAPMPAPANDRSNWLTRRAVAAAIGVLFSAGIAYYTLGVTGARRLETAIGEQRIVTLADGSRISLNTATELTVDIGKEARRLSLTRGEALFEVAPDSGRPFIVETPSGSVQAVGTKFAVRIRNDRQVSVLVTEGKVIARYSSDLESAAASRHEQRLRAGQEFQVLATEAVVYNVGSEKLMTELAWRHGDVVFQGESLAEAVAEMQRYTKTRLVVDRSVSNLSVGGYFRTNDTEAFIATVEAVFPVKAVRSHGLIRLTPQS